MEYLCIPSYLCGGLAGAVSWALSHYLMVKADKKLSISIEEREEEES